MKNETTMVDGKLISVSEMKPSRMKRTRGKNEYRTWVRRNYKAYCKAADEQGYPKFSFNEFVAETRKHLESLGEVSFEEVDEDGKMILTPAEGVE